MHQEHKRETEKTALANKTIYTLIWYGFYYLRSRNGVGAILTAPEPTRGKHHVRLTSYNKRYIRYILRREQIVIVRHKAKQKNAACDSAKEITDR